MLYIDLIAAGATRCLNLLLPPQCPITNEAIERAGLLSARGWSQLKFIDDPVCARCGAPFAYEVGEGAECAACIAAGPAFDRVRAAVVYNDASHKLIVAYKHADRTDLAPLFAGWLKRAGAPVLGAGALIAPTPLHPMRLFKRRYNQAALLAQNLAKATGCEIALDALRRTRATPPQQEQVSADARRRNVAGAFEVPEDRRALVAGRRVVLVDDVLTTGSTLSAAARALKRAGAVRVDGLVLARVVKDGRDAL